MILVKTAMEHYWGQRCDGYAQGCPICEAWGEYDAMQGSESNSYPDGYDLPGDTVGVGTRSPSIKLKVEKGDE